MTRVSDTQGQPQERRLDPGRQGRLSRRARVPDRDRQRGPGRRLRGRPQQRDATRRRRHGDLVRPDAAVRRAQQGARHVRPAGPDQVAQDALHVDLEAHQPGHPSGAVLRAPQVQDPLQRAAERDAGHPRRVAGDGQQPRAPAPPAIAGQAGHRRGLLPRPQPVLRGPDVGRPLRPARGTRGHRARGDREVDPHPGDEHLAPGLAGGRGEPDPLRGQGGAVVRRVRCRRRAAGDGRAAGTRAGRLGRPGRAVHGAELCIGRCPGSTSDPEGGPARRDAAPRPGRCPDAPADPGHHVRRRADTTADPIADAVLVAVVLAECISERLACIAECAAVDAAERRPAGLAGPGEPGHGSEAPHRPRRARGHRARPGASRRPHRTPRRRPPPPTPGPTAAPTAPPPSTSVPPG